MSIIEQLNVLLSKAVYIVSSIFSNGYQEVVDSEGTYYFLIYKKSSKTAEQILGYKEYVEEIGAEE